MRTKKKKIKNKWNNREATPTKKCREKKGEKLRIRSQHSSSWYVILMILKGNKAKRIQNDVHCAYTEIAAPVNYFPSRSKKYNRNEWEKKRKRIECMQYNCMAMAIGGIKLAKTFWKTYLIELCIYIYKSTALQLYSSTALSLHSFHYLHIALAIAIHCTFVGLLCLQNYSICFVFSIFHFDVATAYNVETNIIMFHGRANPLHILFIVLHRRRFLPCVFIWLQLLAQNSYVCYQRKHCFNSQVNTE